MVLRAPWYSTRLPANDEAQQGLVDKVIPWLRSTRLNACLESAQNTSRAPTSFFACLDFSLRAYFQLTESIYADPIHGALLHPSTFPQASTADKASGS
jgi:hypothetical protein